jgi:hypothetical protein
MFSSLPTWLVDDDQFSSSKTFCLGALPQRKNDMNEFPYFLILRVSLWVCLGLIVHISLYCTNLFLGILGRLYCLDVQNSFSESPSRTADIDS